LQHGDASLARQGHSTYVEGADG